jgi:hypothetical protein
MELSQRSMQDNKCEYHTVSVIIHQTPVNQYLPRVRSELLTPRACGIAQPRHFLLVQI